MAKHDSEFEILFSKYNIAVAKAKDLQEQLATKQEQWQERNQKIDIIEQNVRELCESILAKDKNEMILGADYSWNQLETLELISKSKRVFREYNAERTNILRKIMDEAEDRREQVESLKEQIIQMKVRGGNGKSKLTLEELEEQVEKEAEEKKKQEASVKASKVLSPSVQQAAKSGKLHIEQVKADIANGKVVVEGQDEDFFDEDDVLEGATEAKLIGTAIKRNVGAKLTNTSMTSIPSKKEQKFKTDKRKESKQQYTLKLLDEFEDKISDAGWIIMEVIGKFGFSTAKEICEKGLELSSDIKNTKSKLTTSLNDLEKNHLLFKQKVSTPFAQITVYNFTQDAALIYKNKFGKEAVVSEADRLIAEHDNLVHGYSIRDCARVISNAGFFKKTEIWNRKNNVIRIQNGVQYIPDIVCIGENGDKLYIEYERDHYEQKSFNVKLNKMLFATPIINFVAPNREICESLCKKMEKWAETKGTGGNMQNVVLRVTMAKSLNTNLREDKNWAYTYRPTKDKRFVNNF